MKYCAGIVTYNPDIKRLKKNIASIISQISLLIICDNGSRNIKDIIRLIQDRKNIILINNLENKGIAYALNRIFEYAIKQKYEWVLTLDQDSICPADIINKYANYCNNIIGIISPNFRDPCVDYGIISTNEVVQEVVHCITSGSLTNVKAWESVKGFDELMFIDFVDYDFCFRIKQKGYKILQIPSVTLNHTIGRSEEKNIFGKKIILSNHPNMRKYYIVRNYIYYRYKNNITDVEQKIAMKNKILKTLLFEKDKFGSLHAFLLGWIDGNRIIHGRKPKGWTN